MARHVGPNENNTVKSAAACVSSRDGLLDQLRRRHHAAQRLVGGDPLTAAERCGVPPVPARTYDELPLTAWQIERAIVTMLALTGTGSTPIFRAEVWRLMWKAAPQHRKLIESLAAGQVNT